MNSRRNGKLEKPVKEGKSIVNLLTKTKPKTPGPYSLRGISILHKMFQKIERTSSSIHFMLLVNS